MEFDTIQIQLGTCVIPLEAMDLDLGPLPAIDVPSLKDFDFATVELNFRKPQAFPADLFARCWWRQLVRSHLKGARGGPWNCSPGRWSC